MKIPPSEIRKIVEGRLSVDLSTRDRKTHRTVARKIYFIMCHAYSGERPGVIASEIGRDRVTALYHLALKDVFLMNYPEYRDDYREIEREILTIKHRDIDYPAEKILQNMVFSLKLVAK